MIHCADYRIVVGTAAQALATYDHMRALAVHAVPINAGLAIEEAAWGVVHEVIGGELLPRRGYRVDSDGMTDEPEVALGDGPFVVSGMAPYPDAGHAANAAAHAEALAQQGAAVVTAAQMQAFGSGPLRPTRSRGGVHINRHEEGEPCEMGARFAVALPAEGDGVQWVAGEAVVAGDRRWYDAIEYEAVQPHTTQAGWEPPNVPALWVPV